MIQYFRCTNGQCGTVYKAAEPLRSCGRCGSVFEVSVGVPPVAADRVIDLTAAPLSSAVTLPSPGVLPPAVPLPFVPPAYEPMPAPQSRSWARWWLGAVFALGLVAVGLVFLVRTSVLQRELVQRETQALEADRDRLKTQLDAAGKSQELLSAQLDAARKEGNGVVGRLEKMTKDRDRLLVKVDSANKDRKTLTTLLRDANRNLDAARAALNKQRQARLTPVEMIGFKIVNRSGVEKETFNVSDGGVFVNINLENRNTDEAHSHRLIVTCSSSTRKFSRELGGPFVVGRGENISGNSYPRQCDSNSSNGYVIGSRLSSSRESWVLTAMLDGRRLGRRTIRVVY